MQRVIKLPLNRNEELIKTIFQYNQIVNEHIRISVEHGTKSKKELHNGSYKLIRERYPTFPSALIQCARDNAIEILKSNGTKEYSKKADYSSIRCDKRTFSINKERNQISISTIDGRKKFELKIPKYFQKYLIKKHNIKSCQIGLNNNHIQCNLVVELDKPKPFKNKKVLGIDLGLKKMATLSNVTFLKPKELNKFKRKFAYLRKELQSKGTKSAKRKLKKLSGREQRFTKDYNHKISKEISELPFRYFVLEKLKNIRKGRKGKVFNRKRSNWSYFQFRQFLTYKTEEQGKEVILVEPQYTSQRCSKCGHIEKGNRIKGNFKCKSCNYKSDSDLNASRNISQLGKIFVEQGVCQSPKCNQTSSYSLQNNEGRVTKPIISMVGH